MASRNVRKKLKQGGFAVAQSGQGMTKVKPGGRGKNRALNRDLLSLPREEKRALLRVAKSDPRWNFDLDDLSVGPFSLGKLSMGSSRSTGTETVGVAPHSEDIQISMPRIVSSYDKGGHPTDVLCGTEFLTPIGTGTAVNAGAIMFSFPINPNNFIRTRLAQFAPLYQRYKFRSLSFHYQAIAPATTSGQLIGFGDYDVDNTLTVDEVDNLNIAAAHLGQRVCQVWEHKTFPFGVVDDYTTMFTSLNEGESFEPRLIYQGNYYLIAASDLPENTALGNIYVSYECEFHIPQLYPSGEIPGPADSTGSLYIGHFHNDVGGTHQLFSGELIPLSEESYLGNNIVAAYDDALNTVTMSVPNGQYYVQVVCSSTTGSMPDPSTHHVWGAEFVSGVGLSSPVYSEVDPCQITAYDCTTLSIQLDTEVFGLFNVTTGTMVLKAQIEDLPTETFGSFVTSLTVIRLGTVPDAPEVSRRRPRVFGHGLRDLRRFSKGRPVPGLIPAVVKQRQTPNSNVRRLVRSTLPKKEKGKTPNVSPPLTVQVSSSIPRDLDSLKDQVSSSNQEIAALRRDLSRLTSLLMGASPPSPPVSPPPTNQ